VLDNLFDSVLSTTTNITTSFSVMEILICTVGSFILGIAIALIYMYHNNYSKNFVVTLALLPAVVQIVIMLVNGNLGTGVAVMGAFSLVRFRSYPGGAKEITIIFLAMGTGLATGMGFIAIAALFVVIIGLMNILLNVLKFGENKKIVKELKITIPETLDYTGLFDDLFDKYTTSVELQKVKTTHMGSLYQLQYHIELKDQAKEKAFIDEVRCRNGNLDIICGKISMNKDEL